MTAQIRLKVLPKFPASVVADPGGIIITRTGQTYTFSIDPTVIPSVTTPTVVTTSGIVLTIFDVVVQTNQVGAISLTVPSSVSWATQNSRFGIPLTIMDISGTATANPVTVNFTGGQTASGAASLTINRSYGVIRLTPKFGGGWIVS